MLALGALGLQDFRMAQPMFSGAREEEYAKLTTEV